MFRFFILLSALTFVGCSVNTTQVRPTEKSQKVIFGPGVTTNHSPSTVGVMCTGRQIAQSNLGFARVAVGNFKDLTGKFSNDDAGYKVTQGAQHMIVTTLGKLNTSKIRVLERSDISVFNFEMELAQGKLLGGGSKSQYKLPNGKTVPFKPLKAGQVVGSDYFITGAITEINYNIKSGGLDPEISNVGAGKRIYALNVAVDMRVVKTSTLEVIKSVSLQKQIVGYEWKADVFRFFGSELFDLNAGQKIDEPIQLGVRTVIEQSTAMLIGSLYGINSRLLFNNVETNFEPKWITDPKSVADTICPAVVVNKVVKQVKPKPRKVYNPGACTNIIDECEFCRLRKIAQDPLKTQPKGYYVQVAAHNDKKDAFNEWSCLEKNYAPLVDDHTYVVKRNSIGLYALQIGPFITYNQANKYCGEVKSNKLDCYVEHVD